MGYEKKIFKDFSLYIPIYPPFKPKQTPGEQYLKKQVKDFQAHSLNNTPIFSFYSNVKIYAAIVGLFYLRG